MLTTSHITWMNNGTINATNKIANEINLSAVVWVTPAPSTFLNQTRAVPDKNRIIQKPFTIHQKIHRIFNLYHLFIKNNNFNYHLVQLHFYPIISHKACNDT